MTDTENATARHVSTRCPQIAQHGRLEQTSPGRWERTFPEPCEECYSVESIRIPWEAPGNAKPLRTNDAEAELARVNALLKARTDALNRTVKRAETAEAKVARVEKFHEALYILGNLPIEQRPDGLTASVEACRALAADLGDALDGEQT